MPATQDRSSTVVTTVIIIMWYCCNTGVLLLNKALFSIGGLKSPIFLTLSHMWACAFLGYLLSYGSLGPISMLRSRRQLLNVLLLAGVFCLSVMLGNLSLQYIPVSFNQMIGATTPFFAALLSVIIQGARESTAVYLTLIPIVGGVVIASGGEPLFNALGFTACIVATFCRALKSVLQSTLMTDSAEKLDPMTLLYYMSSFSVLLLLLPVLIFEPTVLIQVMHAKPVVIGALLTNSCLAYAVNLTNFLVTKKTSALTLQVLGNIKGVIAASLSIAVFNNPITIKGIVGYCITVIGAFAYSETKRRSATTKMTLEQGSTAVHLLPGAGGIA